MNQDLPVFDVQKYTSTTFGGAMAVAMAAAKRPVLTLQDLPNPPAVSVSHKPS